MTSSPARAAEAACRPAVECCRPRQTTTDASDQNSTGPLSEPVTSDKIPENNISETMRYRNIN